MRRNQLKVGTVLSFVSLILGNLISIIYTPVMLRLLGQSEYGLYNLVSSVVAYLGLLNFGFGSAYIRYYLRYKVKNDEENIEKLNGIFLIVFSIIGFVAVVAGTILAFNARLVFGSELTINELSTAKILLILMAVNMGISFPNVVFTSYITANEEFIFQKFIETIRVIANPLLTLPILLLGYGSIGIVTAATLLSIFVEVSYAVFSFKKINMKFAFKELDISLVKEMTVFSSYIFMNMVIDQINWNLDKFILGRFFGTVSVAIYGLAGQLNNYYKVLSTTISRMFIPRVNTIVSTTNDNTELTDLFTKIGRIQFLILALGGSGLVFFGKSFISMWAGKDYSQSYYIALLLILPITIPLIQNIGIEIQQAKNMHQFRSWTYLIIAVLNVLISIPLASQYGGIGAALGTALSLLVGNGFLMNWYYHNKVGLDVIYFWKEIIKFIPSLIIPFIAGTVMVYYIDLYKIIPFLLSALAYLVIYGISVWLMGMNQYEKNLIISPVKNLAAKILNR